MICDKYMFEEVIVETSSIAKFFDNIIDDKNNINIFYKASGKRKQDYISYLKSIRLNCKLRPCKMEYMIMFMTDIW